MDTTTLIIVLTVLLGLFGVGVLAFFFLRDSRKNVSSNMKGMLSSANMIRERQASLSGTVSESSLTKTTTRKKGKKKEDDLKTKLYKAGFNRVDSEERFKKIQLVATIIIGTVIPALAYSFFGPNLMTYASMPLGLFVGYAGPLSYLDRKIGQREEELMYYLPFAIEQIFIGVSSSLDIGPCISQITEMASKRDAFNPVSEAFLSVEKLVRSGLSLENALEEVGTALGKPEVKHAFMFLGQCAKFGGELTKQLQELADSVMTTRQIEVEGKITGLAAKATFPLMMILAGFLAILVSGLLVTLMTGFSSMGGG